jgi:hypothetical protein
MRGEPSRVVWWFARFVISWLALDLVSLMALHGRGRANLAARRWRRAFSLVIS